SPRGCRRCRRRRRRTRRFRRRYRAGVREMAAIPTPTIRLNSGHSSPQLGFGAFQVPLDDAERIVFDALDVGYRHLDTATSYGNADGVGRAIARSGIPRDEIFVTTKLFREDHGYESALAALTRSLERLGLEAV